MDPTRNEPISSPSSTTTENIQAASTEKESSAADKPSILSWTKSLRISSSKPEDSQQGSNLKSTFSRFTGGFNLRSSPSSATSDESLEGKDASNSVQQGVFGSITRGIVDSSKSAVKAVQVKARHIVSQNKRRYQEGGFDLDMTYITENIIAMGFPAGDMSSGFFGYVEGFYRNHMEEVIRFFESHHKGKYKVYNLCSERLYDASLLEGKVASFPFDDHNCPPLQLVVAFCQSAYSWLKEDIENVVVVHCKAGMARTGLMITSLLLYLKFFPTAEESMDYYNQKRCLDAKGLVLPSQIRYVKYFERILTYFNGDIPSSRRCMLRGFRLHRCPYWVRPSITISNHNGVLFSTKKHPRTKDLMPEDFWFSAPKKGVMVFALPGEPGLTEVSGDFKIHFHDRQGDFYCWLNTTMTENRKILTTADLDGFDKRKLPSPGFMVEVVLVDYDGSTQSQPAGNAATATTTAPASAAGSAAIATATADSPQKDDVFSDSEGEESVQSKAPKEAEVLSQSSTSEAQAKTEDKQSSGGHNLVSVSEPAQVGSGQVSEFKAIAADASVFSFGDEDDYESD